MPSTKQTTPLEPPVDTSTQRQPQAVFAEDEADFLRTFLDGYSAQANIGKAKKGDKKHWVQQNVYNKYIDKFDSARDGGPNLQSLSKVWFSL